MPSDASINVTAQIVASRKWNMSFRDVKAAFSQSLQSNRRRSLACRQPRTGPFPGARPGQLIRLNAEVYGLVSGPARWMVSFLAYLIDEGYNINELEHCALTLPGHGVMERGDQDHTAAMIRIVEKIRFG